MTFKKFILHFSKVNLPIGDLANDIEGDKEFPDSNNYTELRNYLELHNACPQALDTFDNAFEYYKKEYADQF